MFIYVHTYLARVCIRVRECMYANTLTNNFSLNLHGDGNRQDDNEFLILEKFEIKSQ